MTSYGIIGLGHAGTHLASQLTAHGHSVLWTSADTAPHPTLGEAAAIDAIAACDVVIECLPEDRAIKVEVLSRLGGTPAAVLTMTSSFTVAELAAESGLGSRLAGFHFLPSYGGELVELVTAVSDKGVRESAAGLAADLGLETIEVLDRPGRISRRLIVPFMENVLRAVELGVAAPDAIDQVVILGLGHEVGPLKRLREAGLDDHRAAAEALRNAAPTTND